MQGAKPMNATRTQPRFKAESTMAPPVVHATADDALVSAQRTHDDFRTTELAMLMLRVSSGLLLAVAYGINKIPPTDGFVAFVGRLGFPQPLVFGWAAGIAEFVGGFLLALGLFTRPAAFFIALTMAVAAFIAESGNALNERAPALILLVVALTFLLAGPGRFSIDRLIRTRRSRS